MSLAFDGSARPGLQLPGKIVPLDQLESACPDHQVDAAHRLDPYWADMWSAGSSAVWLSRQTAHRRAAMGVGRLTKAQSRWTPQQALEVVLGKGRTERLAELAATWLWRTLTTQQLAAITGRLHVTSGNPVDLDLWFATGLVQRGGLPPNMSTAGLPKLVRPDPHGDFDALARRLTYDEWLAVSAGRSWQWGSQFDRHNLLATELALRVAEWCPVAAVFGESLGTLDLLTGRLDDRLLAARAADAVVVRADGLKIAVEMTTTGGARLDAKIQHWASMLAADRTRSLVVCFVETSPPDRPPRSNLANHVRARVEQAAYGTSDVAFAKVAERMFVVRWRDWFPQPGRVLRSFTALPAMRPTGPRDASRHSWRPANLLDPFELPYPGAQGRDAPALLSNANLVLGQPRWLRTGPGPDLAAALRRRAGLHELPIPPAVRAGGVDRRREVEQAWRSAPLTQPLVLKVPAGRGTPSR